MSPGAGASQRIDIPGRVIDWVQHDHAAPATDQDLDQGATTSLGVVMPDMRQAGHADDRVMDLAGGASPCLADNFPAVAALMISLATHKERGMARPSPDHRVDHAPVISRPGVRWGGGGCAGCSG